MTRSGEPAPTWDENWRLLRQLWPSWEPTAEAIRHVWFLAYDKPNAPQGAGFIDHGALKKAIIEHARSSRWKEPEFLAISKLYTEYKNEKITTRAKNAMRSKNAAELDVIQREHEQRMATVVGRGMLLGSHWQENSCRSDSPPSSDTPLTSKNGRSCTPDSIWAVDEELRS